MENVDVNGKAAAAENSSEKTLTRPCLSEMLLVSLSLWKEMIFCIHCSPVAGLSGWMYILFGISGSALPAITHRLKIEKVRKIRTRKSTGMKRACQTGKTVARHLFGSR